MNLSLPAKIVMSVVILGVIGGMIALIVVVANNQQVPVETTTTSSTTTTTTTTEAPEPGYEVGVGIADMTGPCAEIGFMGYDDIQQTGRGIHTRQYSRAFIFVKGDTRVVLVTTDAHAVGLHVRREVVNRLQAQYGNVYHLRNVIITGTHTHSAPGGHLVDFLLDISVRGFSRETFNAYIDGITRSIIRAHGNIVPAQLFYSTAKVANAQRNRSWRSYDANPAEERAQYDKNFDDTLTQVRILKENGDLHGVMNWFAVHTTSMNMTNRLISSDNFGYAAISMEKTLNPSSLVGSPVVVAGFFSSNQGDVSPNVNEPRCEFSGVPCDNEILLCDAQELCFATGPGEDMFESTKTIGRRIYEGAMEALSIPGEELTGELDVVHQFVSMSSITVPKYDPITKTFDENQRVSGCIPALGDSFASGTTDGPSVLNITQVLDTFENLPWVEDIIETLSEPTEEDIICHAPKPILLATGRVGRPILWHPRSASASLIWLGGLVILGVPGEPSTMAGRRMRSVVEGIMREHGHDAKVVVSGLTNEYIHYVTTFEEYQEQRYEAASTIFGPHTLDIFLNKFAELTTAVIKGEDVNPGPASIDFLNHTISFILPVVADNAPRDHNFGDVVEQPADMVRRGQTTSATFIAANPRNELRQESSYVVVQWFDSSQWVVVATDADWETKFHWQRTSTIFGTSSVTFEWTVPTDAAIGLHRIIYYGMSRDIFGRLRQFTGTTNVFRVDI